MLMPLQRQALRAGLRYLIMGLGIRNRLMKDSAECGVFFVVGETLKLLGDLSVIIKKI
ncbi:hypothetical protein NST84_03395 [Paenibacillus sp. FSL R7-0345]|uniref:hypothetical protein n=1 Tax=Paenibacillus sp. FSL R7-0345 TaxID=2954535 RepID=UPI00315B1FCD